MEWIWVICVILLKLFAGIGLIVLPLCMIGYGAFTVIRFRNPKEWKETEAVITNSIVKEEGEPGENISYRNEINFSYTVEGRSYDSSTAKMPMRFTYNHKEAKEIALTNPIGKNMRVLYHSCKPSLVILGEESDLLRLKRLGFGLFIGGLLTAPVTIFMFFVINRF